MTFVARNLEQLTELGLRRRLKLRSGEFINFSTNDYLNLSKHPNVIKKAIEATTLFGAGSGGSRLMTGNLALHEELELQLALLTGMESSLVYGSGFLTNFGVLTALAGRNDVIFSDRLNHASIIDGAIASGAKIQRYNHNDVEHLETLIRKTASKGRKIIVTDSVFSMDGDIAPLTDIAELSKREGCILVVDEAHAIGVFGSGGGVCRELSLKADVITGTLSKALGGYGGFVGCSAELREFFINKSRSFIYTTALPPSSVGAALGALEVVTASPEMGRKLRENANYFRESLGSAGFHATASASQIVPHIIGKSEEVVRVSASLEQCGILAVAIRPPTVPIGTARLRFSLSLEHSREDIDRTVSELKDEVKEWK